MGWEGLCLSLINMDNIGLAFVGRLIFGYCLKTIEGFIYVFDQR